MLIHQKLSLWFFIIAIIFFTAFRIILPIHTGQFGPDEALFALRAKQISNCLPHPEKMIGPKSSQQVVIDLVPPCGKIPLKGLMGRLGVSYGPYLSYWLTFLYLITNFNLSFIFLISSLLFILTAFFIAESVSKQRKTFLWISVFLLSFTAPLMVTFSLNALWDGPWLIHLSALIIYLSTRTHNKKVIDFIVIGSLCGIAIGSHIQTIPFVFGFGIWLYLRTNNKKALLPFYFGLLLFGVPYLFKMVFSIGKIITHTHTFLQNKNITDLFLNFGYFLRFIGLHPYSLINTSNSLLLKLEFLFAWSSVGVQCVLLFTYIIYIYYYYKHSLRKTNDQILKLITILIVVYAPLALIGTIGREPQESMMIWWIGPVLLAFFISKVHSFKIKWALLTIVVFFQISLSFMQYLPRLYQKYYLSYPHGPNYQTYQIISRQICTIVKKQGRSYRINIAIDSTIPKHQLLFLIMPAITAITDSDCTTKIKFVEKQQAHNLQITADWKKQKLLVK